MTHWRFMDYQDAQGENLVRKWYDAQIPPVRVAVMWAIKEVSVTEELSENPTFNPLTLEHVGLFTLRVSPEINRKKRQFRAIGFWSLADHELILAGGCEKSGRVMIPPGAYENVLDIQLRYYRSGIGTICQHPF